MELVDLFTSFIFIFHGKIYYFIIRRESWWCYQSLFLSAIIAVTRIETKCWNVPEDNSRDTFNFSGSIVVERLALPQKEAILLAAKRKSNCHSISFLSFHTPSFVISSTGQTGHVSEWTKSFSRRRSAVVPIVLSETSFKKLLSGSVPEFNSCHERKWISAIYFI